MYFHIFDIFQFVAVSLPVVPRAASGPSLCLLGMTLDFLFSGLKKLSQAHLVCPRPRSGISHLLQGPSVPQSGKQCRETRLSMRGSSLQGHCWLSTWQVDQAGNSRFLESGKRSYKRMPIFPIRIYDYWGFYLAVWVLYLDLLFRFPLRTYT